MYLVEAMNPASSRTGGATIIEHWGKLRFQYALNISIINTTNLIRLTSSDFRCSARARSKKLSDDISDINIIDFNHNHGLSTTLNNKKKAANAQQSQ